MKITDLEEYLKLKNEIKMLEERIKKYESKAKQVISDTVKGSRLCAPYDEHIITITGGDESNWIRMMKCRLILADRKERAEAKTLEIEIFIDTIKSSEIRQIITLKYLEGRSWPAVSKYVYGYPSENRARMRITRFFAEN